jgi:glycosyltransferase involved in cell wall biosynthesis
MKLLIYSHFFAPSVGGVENIVRKLATGLATRQNSGDAPEFEVTLVSETPAQTFSDSVWPFRIVRKPGVFALAKLIRHCDLLHIAGPAFLPLFLARLLRKAVVVEHHGYQSICPNGSLLLQPNGEVCPGHFQAGHYATCLRCQHVEFSFLYSLRSLILTGLRGRICTKATNVAVTHHVADRLQPLLCSQVIYHGVEDAGSVSAFRSDVNTDPPAICFAYVGRFVSEKGIPLLLEAAKLLRNEGRTFDLLLIGDGPDREQLQTQVEKNGLASFTRITGFLKVEPLNNLLEKVHAVVVPSLSEETAGLAAIEQMMRGRVVIASSIGGLAEVVGDAGLLFPPRDIAALAACMRSVIKEPELIVQLGSKARKRALDLFTADRMLEEHARLYHHLTEKIPT